MTTCFKLKGINQKRIQQVIYERYCNENEIYVINGTLNHNYVSNSDIIIPSIECLTHCMHLLSSSISLSSLSSSILLILSSSLHDVLDNHSIPFSYQKVLKSCLLESPSITTMIFFNEFYKKIASNEKSINENRTNYNARIFIDACKYLKSNNNNITIVAIDTYDNLYSLCKSNNINVITLNDLNLQQSNSSLSMSSNVNVDIDEFLMNYRKGNVVVATTSTSTLHQFRPYLSNTDIRIGLASGRLLRGTVCISKYLSHQAEVELHSHQHYNKVIIEGVSEINRAIDGDEVVIKIDNNTKTASVVGILKRSIREITATVPNGNTTSSDNILVIPIDRRIPKIRVKIRNWHLLQNHKIVVIIDDWLINSNYPHGHYVRLVGPCGDLRTEIDSLLLKNSIFPRPFSANALACLPMTPITRSSHEWLDSGWIMPENEVFDGTRLDMRSNRRVFSVDPEGCQDIDDAMSVEWIRPGVIEVAISIADVCAFVPHLSALDIEARNRGTTVYLVDQRIDMLPSLLSSDIASLHGNKDRFAFTVKMTANVYHSDKKTIVTEDKDPIKLDDSGDIVFELNDDVWVGRTAIRSVAAMTYEQAHNLIYNKNPNIYSNVPAGQAGGFIVGSLHQNIRKDLKLLTAFARFLKKRRQVNGSFDLHSSVELKYQTDLEGNPITIKHKEELEIHDTIAELMIITNSKVAELICRSSTTATTGGLVRTHMPPSQEEFEKLQTLFDLAGLQPPQSFSEVNDVLNKLISDNSGTSKNVKSVIDYMTSILIKSMSEAKYCCSATLVSDLFSNGDKSAKTSKDRTMGHFGLGLKYYTHFTSPIRRYADVVVHRQLLSVITSSASPKSSIITGSSGYLYKAVAPQSSIMSVLDLVNPEPELEINASFNATDDLLDSLLDNDVIDIKANCVNDDDLLDSLLGTNKSNSATHNTNTNRNGNIDDLLDQLLQNDTDATSQNVHSNVENALIISQNDTSHNSSSCPYDGRELENIADHLNIMNRRSKQVQRDVSKLYLSIYFSKHTEEHNAIIYDVKDNMVLVYLPIFDYKGSISTNTNITSKTLLPMQRIKVQVSCESIDSLNLTLTLISVDTENTAFKTNFNIIANSIASSKTAINDENAIASNEGNQTKSTSNIFSICKKFGKNSSSSSSSSSGKVSNKEKAVVARMEANGRIAFGDLSGTSLFFQSKEIESSSNQEKALLVAASSLSKGRDAAYLKMKLWGEEWAEEEELEAVAAEQNTGQIKFEEDSRRKYQKDAQLAMTRLNQLKVIKKKSKMY